MNLGLEDYGSGSDNDSDNDSTCRRTTQAYEGRSKITIGLPALDAVDDDDDLKDERPVAKKPRLEAGAGRSSLLAMLPAPKQKNPVLPAPERVLGGGTGPGLVFNASRPAATKEAPEPEPEEKEQAADIPETSSTSILFRPASLAKGRANISLEEGNTTAPPRTTPKAICGSGRRLLLFGFPQLKSSSSKSSLPSLSSAPVIPTFEPPAPTPTDPYPGNGKQNTNAHVRALEKGQSAAVEEVDAMAEMEKAKLEMRDREERKAVTRGADGAPAAPNIKLTQSKSSGIARSRHQLATMLHQAYANREALEEKIAEGRRNRKEAGQQIW
ncbi:mitotic checkpoint regulator, MAD2B-interacting-domain-containing protein [Mycena rebaudengoi]|nr:mitotic checkpoint regulator, MAD2B-interacting-domain-containing protein [Mycena rebaudengoi]